MIKIKIAEVRALREITQVELAARLGVKQPTVSRWERVNTNLTLVTLAKIADALGCSAFDLIEEVSVPR